MNPPSLIALLTVLLATPLGATPCPTIVWPEYGAAVFHVFSNREAKVPLLVWTPPSPAEGAPTPTRLRAQLFQTSLRLAAPVGPERELAIQGPLLAGGWARVEVSVALPPVERETMFELRVRSPSGNEVGWCPAGRLHLRVYAENLLADLRAWTTSHPLVIDDPLGPLAEFLRSQELELAEGRRSTAPGAVSLYTDPKVRKEWLLARQTGTAVVFRERPSAPPRLTIERTSTGLLIEVEIPMLDRLASDPLAQKTLVEIFRVIAAEPAVATEERK